MTMEPKVYSYIRFSTPEQKLGDSERRQVEMAKAYADEKGFFFDQHLMDEGLSGYHGNHRKKGALGSFLQRVEHGEVAVGSILVVENIDRLGRESILDALDSTIFRLIRKGVAIQTLQPRDFYDEESLKRNGIYRLIAQIDVAHAESEKKSERGKQNWQQKRRLARENGRILTKRAPAWLMIKDNKFVEIPEATIAISKIFDLKLDGLGKTAIAKAMNRSSGWRPPRGNGWRESYVEKILNNKAVIGEYQPHRIVDGKRVPDGKVIQDYYPRIIGTELFEAVQEIKASMQGKGGRTGKARNLFRHIAKCGYCGASMVFVDKGPSKRGGRYLWCENARLGVKKGGVRVCSKSRVRYNDFQDVILANLHRLKPEQFLPQKSDHEENLKRLRTRQLSIDEAIRRTEEGIQNTRQAVSEASTPQTRKIYDEDLAALLAALDDLNEQRRAVALEFKHAETAEVDFEIWKSDLAALKSLLQRDEPDLRIRLGAHLREMIDRIEVYGRGNEYALEHFDEYISEYIPELSRSPSMPLLRKYAKVRYLSPEAQYYHVYFKGGRKVDMAPEESLAFHMQWDPLERKQKMKVQKVLGILEDFFDKRKSGFQPKKSTLIDIA